MEMEGYVSTAEKNMNIYIAVSKEQKDVANKIVMDFHSYVKSPRTVGRCIKYLIEHNGEIVGTFWLGSGFKPTPKAILNHMNMGQKQFDLIFNEVADNKRFCMAKSIPNLGSQILKAIRNRAKADWMQLYGNNLQAIVTTIGNDKKGSVYLADNWIKIGETAGLPPNRKSVSMKWDDAEGIKLKYAKPTGENKKTILITQRLGNT
jgi:hypothetical protein